jgi:hypothetical protein
MRLLDKDKISTAFVEKEFFPFFHVENAFLEGVDSSELVASFPNIGTGGSFPSEDIPKGPIKQLIKELESDDFKSILEDKLNVDLNNSKVVTTLRGFSRSRDGQIHTDSKSKILTVLLYLNPLWDNKIGNLRLLKENSNLDDYITEISSDFGNLVAFKVTENCWHGFEPFEGKRLSIQLNYIYPDSLNSHKLRHKISSKLKRFLPSKKS